MVITIDTGYQNRPSWLHPGEDLFFFFSLLVSSISTPNQTCRVYPRCAILQQGMHLNVFSKVYCDRVCFSCAERIMTGSGFDPPPMQRHPPIQFGEVECPPPPRVCVHRSKHLRPPPPPTHTNVLLIYLNLTTCMLACRCQFWRPARNRSGEI